MTAPRRSEYLIRTVEDFLAVPPEKLPECLSDFAQFLSAARSTAKMTDEIDSLLGVKGAVKFDSSVFHWVDDGRGGLSAVQFHTQDGTEIGRIEFPEQKP